MSEANKAIAAKIMHIFSGKADLSQVDQLIAANAVDHQGIGDAVVGIHGEHGTADVDDRRTSATHRE